MINIKSDRGEGVTIMGLASLLLLLLLSIFIVDFTKTMYIKNLYTSFAQKAAQTAIKSQDAIGGLLPTSANSIVTEYMTQRSGGGNTADAQSHRSSCEINGNYPRITISYDNSRQVGSSSVSYSSTNGQIPHLLDANQFYKKQYNTIQIDVVDVTDNYFFGIFGQPCAEVNVTASAITTSHFDEDN